MPNLTYRGIVPEMTEYISGQVEDLLEKFEAETPCQLYANKFPKYNADWCADAFTSYLEDSRNALIDKIVDYVLDELFYNY